MRSNVGNKIHEDKKQELRRVARGSYHKSFCLILGDKSKNRRQEV